MNSEKSLPEKYVLFSLLALALAVRLWGIHFGLPFVYHVDEAWFGQKAINYFTGDLNPHFWHAPSLFTYLVAAVWSIYFLAGKIFGKFTTAASFIKAFNDDPSVFLVLGRLLTVFLSVATIYLVYLIGKRMYNERVGFLAALFLIFSPEHNRISHYMNPDSPMVFFLALSFLFIWRIYKTGKGEYYALAGISAGLAFATKYGGHMLFIPLFLAHLFYVLENRLPKKRIILHPPLIGSALLFLMTFLAACPYVFLDFPAFWKDFRWQSEHLYTLGHFGSSTAQPSALFYLQYGFRENIGLIAQFLVAGGLVYGLWRFRRREVLLFSFPVLLFATISPWKTYATRYLLPAAPFFILIAAFFLDAALKGLSNLLGSFSGKKWAGFTAAGLIVLFILVPSAVSVFRLDWSLAHKDTRTVARDWIYDNIPEKSKVAFEAYCPLLSENRYRLFSRQPSLSQIDLEWLAQKKVEYVVVSELEYGRFAPYPEEFPKEANFYRSLDEKAVLIKTIAPRWHEDLLTMHNPIIKIYRMSRCPDVSFPGNFSRYAQHIALLRTEGDRWVLRTEVSAGGLRQAGEVIKSLYVRIVDAAGKEITGWPLDGKCLPPAPDVDCDFSSPPFHIPYEARIVIGYEYGLETAPPAVESPQPLKKEFVLVKSFSRAESQRTRLEYYFLYEAFPGTRGDDYCQAVTLTKAGIGWTLWSSAYGGELRWGDGYALNPYVRVTDSLGRDITKLVLHEGKLGSTQDAQRGPGRKTTTLPELPSGFKVMAGYEYYLDNRTPQLAGGPNEIELKLPPAAR